MSTFAVRRFASSATAAAVALPVFERHSLSRTHLIFGANTDVGKTLTCAGLVRASLAQTTEVSDTTNTLVHYMKPLQCGGSDEKFIERHCPSSQLHRLSRRTLFDWKTPASPHVASRKEKSPVSDHEVLSEIQSTLSDIAVKSSNSGQASTTWIETAGGVLSPSSASPNNCSPSHASDSKDGWGWVTQGDLYHPLSTTASVVLIGDGRLGGISATLSSLESLMIRGYNVAGIVLLETGYDNVTAIREYAGRQEKLQNVNGILLFDNPEAAIVSLPQIPPEPEPLNEWFNSYQVTETLGTFDRFLQDHWNNLQS